MNVELLREVKEHILEEPKRLQMSHWISTGNPGSIICVSHYDPNEAKLKVPDCGTIACIAGWTCILGEPGSNIRSEIRSDAWFIKEKAQKLLGISSSKALKLFFADEWSPRFKSLWFKTKSRKKRAQIAGKVIDSFIKKHS